MYRPGQIQQTNVRLVYMMIDFSKISGLHNGPILCSGVIMQYVICSVLVLHTGDALVLERSTK